MSPSPVRRSCPYAPDASAYLLRALEGSHSSALDDHARTALFEGEWRVANDSNRMGLRLEGPPLPWPGRQPE